MDVRRSRLSRLMSSRFEGEDVERVAASMEGTEAIVIDDLHKTFRSWGKDPVHAVQGVSLKIYPGEITAILGKVQRHFKLETSELLDGHVKAPLSTQVTTGRARRRCSTC